MHESERKRNTFGHVFIFKHEKIAFENKQNANNNSVNNARYMASPIPQLFGNLINYQTKILSQKPQIFVNYNSNNNSNNANSFGHNFSTGLLHGVRVGPVAPAGFPTLKSLVHNTNLVNNVGINVFGSASKRESAIIAIKGFNNNNNDNGLTADVVANMLLGSKCYINWPFLTEAIIIGVSDKKSVITRPNSNNKDVVTKSQESHLKFDETISKLSREMLTNKGIDILGKNKANNKYNNSNNNNNNVSILLHCYCVERVFKHLDGSIHKQYNDKNEILCPLQLTIKDKVQNNNKSTKNNLSRQKEYELLCEEFPINSRAILLSKMYFGSIVTIKSIHTNIIPNRNTNNNNNNNNDNFRFTVIIENGTSKSFELQQKEKHAKSIINAYNNDTYSNNTHNNNNTYNHTNRNKNSHFMNNNNNNSHSINNKFYKSFEVARKLGISPRALGTVTSKMSVKTKISTLNNTNGEEEYEVVDIGLNVRDNGRKLCVPDLAKCVETKNSNNYNNNNFDKNNNSDTVTSWFYSDLCIQLLYQYKTQFPIVFTVAEMDRGESRDFDIDAFLKLNNNKNNPKRNSPKTMLLDIRKWLQSHPLSKRPLVKTTSLVASGEAIKIIQLYNNNNNSNFNSNNNKNKDVELSNVHPGLLLKPFIEKGSIAEGLVSGQEFKLGDIGIIINDNDDDNNASSVEPPFGQTCIVVGIHDGITIKITVHLIITVIMYMCGKFITELLNHYSRMMIFFLIVHSNLKGLWKSFVIMIIKAVTTFTGD